MTLAAFAVTSILPLKIPSVVRAGTQTGIFTK
jgi:hypothetical protein